MLTVEVIHLPHCILEKTVAAKKDSLQNGNPDSILKDCANWGNCIGWLTFTHVFIL